MFEKASRIKLRFNTNLGTLGVEDLWDLPLTSSNGRANLNDIAKGLYKTLQDNQAPDFVDDSAKTDTVLQLQFDVVKQIIEVKKKERDEAAQARDRKDKIQHIQSIIAKKKDEKLEGAPLEELEQQLRELVGE